MNVEPNKTKGLRSTRDEQDVDSKKDLHTDFPLSEKDEVKEAEKKTRKSVEEKR